MLEQNVPIGIRCPVVVIRPLLPEPQRSNRVSISDDHNCIVSSATKRTIAVMVLIEVPGTEPKWSPIRIEYIALVKEAVPEKLQLFQTITNAMVNFDASSEILLNLIKSSME